MNKDTNILHGGGARDPFTGALSIPIYNASTYHQSNVDVMQDFLYGRSQNPTRKALEESLAALEHATEAYAFTSGMAAISAAIMGTCQQGDHLVVTQDIYGGTYKLLTDYLPRFGITHTFADTTSLDALDKAITPDTKALFLESPSNPLLKIVDLTAVAELAARRELVTMIDNTFLSPYLLRPLDLGIDLSIHSATKFLGGHSDLSAGAVMTKSADLGRNIRFVQVFAGSMLNPQDCWLMLRGIKTLGARMKQQEQSAHTIARWLTEQSWIASVNFPGLAEHPGHDILARQADGFGCVISMATDTLQRARRIIDNVKIWSAAVSLGGVESILSYPARMSHASIPRAERDRLGIHEKLLRLSVGLEDPGDLIADLQRAAHR
ncbi:MAG: aminotransferase class I/II-fold pyridoxal phosphate-dependent enzyme [Chitinivibrionales bacterium]|nr:aminotransferase class I/II-fold pyridoxal phosphate-dependent enzyme [Chitinivibrionales bacterium]